MLMWERLRWLGTAVCDEKGAPRAPGNRFTLIRVYAQDIPALLAFNRWLILLTAGVFFVGIVAGAFLAKTYPFATESLLRSYAEQIESLGGAESISTAAILRNNLRILLLSPVLAVLTLGLYPLIVATLPGVILGMLAVQIDMIAPLKVLVGLVLVLPHGVFELPAIAFGSALSMRLAWSLFRPVVPKRHRKRGMGRGKRYQRVCLPCHPPACSCRLGGDKRYRPHGALAHRP